MNEPLRTSGLPRVLTKHTFSDQRTPKVRELQEATSRKRDFHAGASKGAKGTWAGTPHKRMQHCDAGCWQSRRES